VPAPSSAAAAGAKVFASAGCSGCHTLAAAHASGAVGPNLDQVRPSASVVADKVKRGGGGMPAFAGQLSAQQIKDVAAFVASNAGK
jgi:mono/diheme cytochrome c family protein